MALFPCKPDPGPCDLDLQLRACRLLCLKSSAPPSLGFHKRTRTKTTFNANHIPTPMQAQTSIGSPLESILRWQRKRIPRCVRCDIAASPHNSRTTGTNPHCVGNRTATFRPRRALIPYGEAQRKSKAASVVHRTISPSSETPLASRWVDHTLALRLRWTMALPLLSF